MKILNLSDTHSLHSRIPKEWLVSADVLVHGGDICNRGTLHEIADFMQWFDSLDYKYKIFIAGNHCWPFELTPKEVNEILKQYPNIIYLQDNEITIEGIKFYGSPQTPYFYNWAFNCARNNDDALTYNKPLITEYWDKIPLDTNVLITHGPPYGIGDFVPYRGGEFVGCRDLLDTISTKLNNLKAHIFGHIHYSYGTVYKNNIQFINASTVNESYQIVNKPILIEI
jgi:Icc-related predicted phosphoesterase